MTPRSRNVLYWILKVLSILISCALPVWAIYERFPIWTIQHGTSRSAGTGLILMLLVILFIFRRTVFNFMRDRLNLKHAPPLLGWLVLIVLTYALLFVSKFLYDLTIVCWMGFIGCAIGTLITFIAENFVRVENNNGRV